MDTSISIQELQEQLKWEQECTTKGIERYINRQEELANNNKGELTDITQILLKDRVVTLGALIEKTINAKLAKPRSEKYSRLIQLSAINYVEGEVTYDYKKVALIAIKIILQGMYRKDKVPSRTALIAAIGSTLEADLKCLMFKAKYPIYYQKIEESLQERSAMSYIQKLRTIQKKFKDFDIEWNEWTPAHKAGVGLVVFEHTAVTLSDVFQVIMRPTSNGKCMQFVEATQAFSQWTTMINVERGKLHNTPLPLKIEPRDWNEDNLNNGVYYTADTSKQYQLVKKKYNWNRKWVDSFVPQEHMDALNCLQHTPWKINLPVLKIQNFMFRQNLGGLPVRREDLMVDFPEHLRKDKGLYTDEDKTEFKTWSRNMSEFYTDERKRKGQTLAYTHIHKLACELRDWKKFYYGYNADFRGRVYCLTPALSPQGCDIGKGLLTFAQEEEISEDGIKWLALSITSKYGADSQSIDNRVKWVHDNDDLIREIVKSPIDNRKLWLDADKPFQFLASCLEWAKTDYGQNPNALVSLPVGIDGKCNGLQHYSALLRDTYGATATNLVNCEEPQDIYGEVAKVTVAKLRLDQSQLARDWLAIEVTRKCTKRPVMTLPYGATQHSARVYIREYLVDNLYLFAHANVSQDKQHITDMTNYLTPIVWSSIKEVVTSAVVGMAWIQRNGRKVVKRDGHLKYVTPAGFPVFQGYMKDKRQEVVSELLGSIRVYIRRQLDEPSLVRHGNGLAPNFIHSMDSTHMVKLINRTSRLSNTNLFAMIHDEYGTHPRHMNIMSKVAREEFSKLYTDDILADWKQQLNIEEELPEYGDFDVSKVLGASNAFI